MYWGYDSTYLLLILGMMLSCAATAWMNRVYKKYRTVRSNSGMTGAEAAKRILHAAGIYDVQIGEVAGSLSDHYDPISKRVNLSREVYAGNSLAAVGVAAHECGHAIQHAAHYLPLNFRTAIVPIANLGSSLSWPIFLVGLLTSFGPLVVVGILLFSLAVFFQVITLPVEFNASKRALTMLKNTGILGEQESKGAKAVLQAAALTYVAALMASLLQLLRLVALSRRRRK